VGRAARLNDAVRVMAYAWTLAAVLAVSAACGSSEEPAHPAPTGSTAYIIPPPPVSNTAASGAALQQQMTDAVTRYQDVYSSVYLNPRQNLSIVDTVATGQESAGLRDQAKQVADQHLIVRGAIKPLRVTVVSTTPTPLDSSRPATVVVKSCNDVSTFSGTTPDGKSVVDPKRLPQTQEQLTLVNASPAVAPAWRVSMVESGTTLPCDPA
jgi:hypothetical protein